MYYGSFRRSFEFADGIYVFKENIKKFQEYGIEYLFVENNGVHQSISFQKLHLYVLTQLEWNVNQDTDCLIDEFMNGYYKCAAPYMKKAFDYLMAHMQKVRARHKYLTGREYHSGMCGRDVNYDGIWDLNVAYDISLIFDQADQAIENSDFSAEFKEQLKDRVEAERLLAIYIQLEYFVKELTIYDEARSINFFPKEKALELVDRMEKGCEKFNIVSLDGDGPYKDTLKKWRREIKFTSRGWEKLNVEDFWKMLDDLYEKYEV
jgi:tetratricopeptide (TPR) repeat protein